MERKVRKETERRLTERFPRPPRDTDCSWLKHFFFSNTFSGFVFVRSQRLGLDDVTVGRMGEQRSRNQKWQLSSLRKRKKEKQLKWLNLSSVCEMLTHPCDCRRPSAPMMGRKKTIQLNKEGRHLLYMESTACRNCARRATWRFLTERRAYLPHDSLNCPKSKGPNGGRRIPEESSAVRVTWRLLESA